MRIIEIVPYDGNWPAMFASEAARLPETLGNIAVNIHHIGSTAVPGLAAKAVIDILIEVSSLEALDAITNKMEAIGYEALGEFGIPQRRFFRKGGDTRTHNLHAFRTGDDHVTRHLAFRDFLRTHPDTAKEYAALKTAVAKSCVNDLDRYCDGKDGYVKRLEAIALKTYGG